MTNKEKILCLKARRNTLIAKGKDNFKIIKKINRKIKNLEKD